MVVIATVDALLASLASALQRSLPLSRRTHIFVHTCSDQRPHRSLRRYTSSVMHAGVVVGKAFTIHCCLFDLDPGRWPTHAGCDKECSHADISSFCLVSHRSGQFYTSTIVSRLALSSRRTPRETSTMDNSTVLPFPTESRPHTACQSPCYG